MRLKTLSFLLVLGLFFIFSMTVVISEGEVGSTGSQVGKNSSERVVQEPVSEEGPKEPLVNPINEGEGIYIDLGVLVGEENLLEEKNGSFISEETTKNKTIEETNETLMGPPEVNETESDGGVESDEEVLGIGEEGIAYVDLEEVEPKQEEERPAPSLVQQTLVRNGKVELEFKILQGAPIGITKKELRVSDTEKVVRIESKDHFDDELVAYSDLPQEAQQHQIEIVWENEGRAVTSGVTYIDSNRNGLIDRVSWVVPHLSVQTYTIHISVDGAGSSPVLELSVVSPPNGWTNITNPVQFEVEVDYASLSDVTCILEINSDGGLTVATLDVDGQADYTLEGSVNWTVQCEDDNNASMYDIKSGQFSVLDNFGIAIDNSGFFLKGSDATGTITANGGVLGLTLQKPSGNQVILANESGSLVDYTIDASNLDEVGTHTLFVTSYHYTVPAQQQINFDVGRISLSFDASITEDEEAEFTIGTEFIPGMFYDFWVGGVRIVNDGFISVEDEEDEITHSFNQGNYTVELKDIRIDGTAHPDMFFGYMGVAENAVDGEDPDIDLLYPAWEDIIASSDITFEYAVSDNTAIHNCSLRIYNTSKSTSGVYETGELLFPLNPNDRDIANVNAPSNGDTIGVRLVEFDDGDYIWDVECYDEAENRGWNFNYFEVDAGQETSSGSSVSTSSEGESYERMEEVEGLIDAINDFLEKESTLGPEERMVVEVMGLSSILNLHKKRLLQIDQDMKFNMRFMTDERRAQRIEEINAEIDAIKKDIVTSLLVLESHEYSKSSSSRPLEELLGLYLKATSTNMGKSAFKKLVSFNEELQLDLSSVAKVWRVKLDYISENPEEIILVRKELDVKSSFKGEVLEILPEDFSEAAFLHPVKPLGEGLYELYLADLETGRIVYFLEDDFDLEKLEQTETLLYEEGSIGADFSITGFVVGAGGLGISLLTWIFSILFIGYIGFVGVWKLKLERYKKEPGVGKMLDLVRDCKLRLRGGDIKAARSNYTKMKEIYRAIPRKCQQFFYKDLRAIRLAIDKKEVIALVKEYERAKREYRREDAILLYHKINSVYRKLPKKFQDKIYQRLVKKEV